MTKKFANLRDAMSIEARGEIARQVKEALTEMPLHELRRAKGISQKALAEVLHIQQPAVAKIEHRADMYISTLRSHIEAMGGELEITARFPDGTVKISNFSQL
jgi:ribosome-binding protein aMBF1 (putative translation factor)